MSPPASPTRADGRSVGEEIGQSATSIGAPLRCPPADVAEKAGQTAARTSRNRSHRYCAVAIVTLPAGMTTHEAGTRGGPQICKEGHFGIFASGFFPAVVTMLEDKPDNSR